MKQHKQQKHIHPNNGTGSGAQTGEEAQAKYHTPGQNRSFPYR
jgi:hypothetical protein